MIEKENKVEAEELGERGGKKTKRSVFSSTFAGGEIHHWRYGWQLIYAAAFCFMALTPPPLLCFHQSGP